jgi:hypothetical protein
VVKAKEGAWKTTAQALTGTEIAEAKADKAETAQLTGKEDEGKAVGEDAPPPSTATPIMESVEGGKRHRNHTINYKGLADMQKRSRD